MQKTHNRRFAGFTLLEMMISMALFTAGAVYVYATFSGVTTSSRSATVQIDLGSENKKAMTRLFAELQASSLTPQDTDGIDATEPEPVLVIEDDTGAPAPTTKAKLVNRGAVGGGVQGSAGTGYELGHSKEQARERVITSSKRLRFRKVVGYMFNQSSGTIVPEWSGWVTYSVNDRNQLVRTVPGRPTRVVANHVDAFDVDAKVDGTIVVTMITARRNPTGAGWKRYANAVTIHPKN
jgi:prepilin-type N-terminal cleavage/methylation domain-containing protein